jgi:ferric-dicitrate binding protein FerR (iron transport regulator)
MNDPRQTHDDEARAREILRRLPPPLPGAAYRDELKRAFVSGAFPSPAPRDVAESRLRRASRSPIPWAAAAAALAVVLTLNQGPQWELPAVSGAGQVRIDGASVTIVERSQLARRIRAGAHISLPDSAQMDIALPGVVTIQITGGSDAVVPGRFGRWFARSSEGWLESGELRFSTGPRFRGARLRIRTPETTTEAAGTTFAVIRNPEATCVCVLEGAIAMTGPNAPPDSVRAGFRRSVYRDGRAPKVEPILPMEVMKLTMLRDQVSTPAGK